MYKVIHIFSDLQDGNKVYHVGDVYPHEGVSEERIIELAGSDNKIGVPLIEKVEEPKKPVSKKKPKKANKE